MNMSPINLSQGPFFDFLIHFLIKKSILDYMVFKILLETTFLSKL